MDYSKKTVHYNNFPGTGSFLGIIIVEFCITLFVVVVGRGGVVFSEIIPL